MTFTLFDSPHVTNFIPKYAPQIYFEQIPDTAMDKTEILSFNEFLNRKQILPFLVL